MILDLKPLTLVQVQEFTKDLDEKPELKGYLKKFVKLKAKNAEALFGELKDLKNHKLKDEFVVKIIDVLPRDAEALNKIFIEVSLDEKETNEVLEIVKKY